MEAKRPDEVIEIRVMNEYGGCHLWDEEGGTDAEELGLSAGLTADLEAFAARWDASIPAATFDDRFDHLPVIRSVVDGARAVRTLLDRQGRRAAELEDAAIRAQGEELAARVQEEMGPRYRVTYVHW